MQQLYEESDRQPVTMRESQTYVATPWDRKGSERKPSTIGDSDRHAATQWHC